MICISLINHSTITSDAVVAAMVPDLQTQISRDFAPIWDLDAHLEFCGRTDPIDPACWQLLILDDADQAGALGYHDLSSSGKPIGKVFARADQQAGDALSVTVSHELLEQILDPYVNLSVLDPHTARIMAYEVADAVEDDSLGYKINNTLVSDFVTPQWFEPGFVGPCSFRQNVHRAFELAKGGYIGYFDLHTMRWNQATNFEFASLEGVSDAEVRRFRMAHAAPVGSRRERRSFRLSGSLRHTTPR
jgi:hypothetical protein